MVSPAKPTVPTGPGQYWITPGGHIPIPEYARRPSKSLPGKRAWRIRFDPPV